MQKVVPAILTADPVDLQGKLTILKGHTNWIHIDIMDGKFVPNTSVSLFELGEAYEYFNLEIHLMVTDPEKYFEDCKAIGAKRVIFHFEATENPAHVLAEIEKYEFQKGIALKLETSPNALAPFQERIGSILLMSIEPGFQGQDFVPSVLEKAKETKRLFPNRALTMDGGIGEENIKDAFAAGVDYVVVGSRIVKTENPPEALRKLEAIVP